MKLTKTYHQETKLLKKNVEKCINKIEIMFVVFIFH